MAGVLLHEKIKHRVLGGGGRKHQNDVALRHVELDLAVSKYFLTLYCYVYKINP